VEISEYLDQFDLTLSHMDVAIVTRRENAWYKATEQSTSSMSGCLVIGWEASLLASALKIILRSEEHQGRVWVVSFTRLKWIRIIIK
jgi:hypothetical protein